MQKLRDTFTQGHILLDLDAQRFPAIFHKVVVNLVDRDLLATELAGPVDSLLKSREKEASTAIGHAVALPHAYMKDIDQQKIFFVRLARPTNLGAPDGIPTQFFFFLLGPPDSASQHLDTLSNIARLVSDQELRYELGTARDSGDLLSALNHFTERTTQKQETPENVSEGLVYSGKLFRGLRGKDPFLYPVTHCFRRVPRWTIHASTFLQVACLAVLRVVKSSSIDILFPVFIVLLVPVRLLAGRFFTEEHLAALDV